MRSISSAVCCCFPEKLDGGLLLLANVKVIYTNICTLLRGRVVAVEGRSLAVRGRVVAVEGRSLAVRGRVVAVEGRSLGVRG
jgi:hypothetical protein